MTGKEFFSIETTTQIYTNRKMVVSICRRIIEYNEIYLKIDAGTLYIEIWGSNLTVNDYNSEGIEVSGRIDSVEFSDVPGRNRQT